MSDDITRPDGTESDEIDQADKDAAETAPDAPDGQSDANANVSVDGDTFPRSYVEELRRESAEYRGRAKTAEDRADSLAKRLHAALVTATGTLVDPSALPFDAEHLDNPEKLSAAIDALLSEKPYLKARKPSGDAGQGDRGAADSGLNLLALLKGGR